MTYHIDLHFTSKEIFLKTYPTLFYGEDKEWLVVLTPDGQICALAMRSFPESQTLIKKYQKHTLVEKKIALKDKLTCLLVGTPLQHQVWEALLNIPVGTTVSYQKLADQIQRPKAVRAVANAVGSNPISPLIPCHRVIRSDGHIGGYYWGIPAKIALLKEEGVSIYSLKGIPQKR